jgi:hypothetical protein
VILHSAFHIDVEKHRGHIKNTGVNIEETIWLFLANASMFLAKVE